MNAKGLADREEELWRKAKEEQDRVWEELRLKEEELTKKAADLEAESWKH